MISNQTWGILSRRASLLILSLIPILGQIGCATRGALESTDAMVPADWEGNPWGPRSELARARGELPTIPDNPDMAVWREWGKTHLRDGDVLFRMADARILGGLIPFSKIVAKMSDSPFSHTGITAWEDGEVVVYDTTITGPRRQPFAIWIVDNCPGGFGIKRLRPEYQPVIPDALAYCREVYRNQVPFDDRLKLGADRLYCAEMTEMAYRQAGLTLSDPVPFSHLPSWDEFPVLTSLATTFTSLETDQPAIIPGNHYLGLWSSPKLTTIYSSEKVDRPYHDSDQRRIAILESATRGRSQAGPPPAF